MAARELDTRTFLAEVRRAAEARLDGAGSARAAEWRQRFGYVQASFGRRGIHYEVWLQRPRRQVEVGLHLEADAELNGWLLRGLAAEMPAIWAELGPGFELEQWTASWGRVHRYLPFEAVDEGLVALAAESLVACVRALEPRVAGLLAARERA